jgi:cytochrome P450
MSVTTIGIHRPTVFEANLPAIDYENATGPDEAHRNIGKALEQGPIAMGPHGPEILSYELVRTALRDPRMYPPPGLTLEAQGITSGRVWDKVTSSLLAVNGNAHTRLRRLVSKAFTPRAVAPLDTTIVGVLNQLIDGISASGRCDVVADIARPYPVPVICALFGAPQEDWKMFSEWADDIFKVFTWNVAEYQDDILAAWDGLEAYIDSMVALRRDSLTDDLLSELIRAEDDGDRLTMEELRMLAATILMAGTDTTRNQVAAAMDVFCDHPDQWEMLAEDPELAPKAVEEVMRYAPVVLNPMRLAAEDIEIEGMIIPAGTLVICNTAAANRDPAVYDDPDRFDIAREGAAPMQTFGAGAHYCLGANLARRELVEALVVMSRRMRNPRRTGVATWKPIVGITGPATLPIEFEAA